MGAYNSNGNYRGDLDPDSQDGQSLGYTYRSDPTNSSSEFGWVLSLIVKIFPFRHWKAFVPGFAISWLLYSIMAVIAGLQHNQVAQKSVTRFPFSWWVHFAGDMIFPAILLNIIIYLLIKKRVKANGNKTNNK
ncbi:MAG: hypothetical protein ACYDDB_04060 [bacterium]